MNITSMLVRLQGALGISNLANRMVLLPSSQMSLTPADSLNFLVGYNGSPQSQTALDITLWIAYQTRVATSQHVTVHVVYVVDETFQPATFSPQFSSRQAHATSASAAQQGATATCTLTAPAPHNLERADRVLWEARSFAADWRGSLETHLQVGQLAPSLRQLVETEAATLLVLGCATATHPIVPALGHPFPCPVLGIPAELVEPSSTEHAIMTAS